MIVRIAKQDAAYLYALLESYEGVVNYSTLTADRSLGYRDIEIFTTKSMAHELEPLVKRLERELSLVVLPSATHNA